MYERKINSRFSSFALYQVLYYVTPLKIGGANPGTALRRSPVRQKMEHRLRGYGTSKPPLTAPLTPRHAERPPKGATKRIDTTDNKYNNTYNNRNKYNNTTRPRALQAVTGVYMRTTVDIVHR